MRAIAPRGGRTIEARLTGFAWSPIRVQRGTPPLDPARLELAGAAGSVINKAPNGPDAGIGYLIIDRDADAVEALQDAAQRSPNDTKIWSDLAAARYTLAVRGEKPYELPRALAAADHALRIDANLPDALFNRALIIEHLGINEAARRAWHRYLQTDGTSKWADEALGHLGQLRPVASDAEFKRELGRATAALRAGDPAPIAALTRNYPDHARKWGEGPLFAEWADAVRAGDAARAKDALDLVRAIGRALAEWNHEQLLADAVAVIDSAPPDRLRPLADAEALYRDARIAYSKRKIGESLPLLERSSALFVEAGNRPMSLHAAYYAANAVYDSNRPAEAIEKLTRLRASLDPQRYRALNAEALWELSICRQSSGDWEAAIRDASESLGILTSLGEKQSSGKVGALLAWALERAAQPRAAWTARIRALAALSESGAAEWVHGTVGGAVRTQTERGDYETALALINVALRDLKQEERPNAVQILAYQARLLGAMGDAGAARASLQEARAAAGRIADASLRERALSNVDLAAADVQRPSDPKGSLALVDHAIDFFNSHNEHAPLPDALLQRGRAEFALGDDQAALADFERGIRELDTLRSRFEDMELRSGFYDSAAGLFPEAVHLLLRHKEVDRAFALADRARARTVYERLDPKETNAPLIAASLGPDVMLVEYVILNDGIAIFRAGRSGVEAEIVPVKPAELRQSVERFVDLLQRHGDLADVREQSAALYRILIGPVARPLAGAKRIIIVPDRQLHAVPFAALLNPATHRMLVEDFTITIAPNAASCLRSASSSSNTALIVGDPTAADTAALPDAVREAQAIAAMYHSATVLIGERATRSRFLEGARSSGIIHYAGHARSDTRSSLGTLRLAPDADTPGGELEASEIARMHLTNTPLVVLAACGTIRGDADHVEGMPSVARAFLAAGARGVVGTLWEIDDDAAAQLFRRFHQRLSDGQSAAAALRDAQIELLRSGDARLQHPSTWAPVEVLGGDQENERK
jgi:CHAT domain-containing protein